MGISLLHLRLRMNAREAEVHWPNTVAIPAPMAPIAGMPNQPKMNTGSRIRLTMEPLVSVIMNRWVLPVDTSRRSSTHWNMVPIDSTITVRRYATPFSIMAGSLV